MFLISQDLADVKEDLLRLLKSGGFNDCSVYCGMPEPLQKDTHNAYKALEEELLREMLKPYLIG